VTLAGSNPARSSKYTETWHERIKAPVPKTGGCNSPVGSNPTVSSHGRHPIISAPHMLRWSNGLSRQALNLENAGSIPARSTQDNGPVVYGLGSGLFTPGNGVRLSVGLLRVGGVRYLACLISRRPRVQIPYPLRRSAARQDR
jgi:hypothetical protein